MLPLPVSSYRLRRNAKSLGLRGNGGGWIRLPTGRSVAGWYALECWVRRQLPLPANLAEIVEGRRVGVPTLRAIDDQEFAAALLSPVPVCLRTP